MPLIMFAKHTAGMEIPETVAKAKAWGLDGLDYPVRKGYAVNPENFATRLPELVRALRAEGLALPLLTGEGDLLDPATCAYAERLIGVMADAGVPFLKLGYFRLTEGGPGHWEVVDQARAALGRWEALARRYGVTVCYHTHSGPFVGGNAAAVMHLLRGFDPQCLGAYLDTGHLAASGEDFPFACAVVGGYLKIVALKDMTRVKEMKDGVETVTRKVFRPGGGVADFPEVFRHLRRIAFAGPLTIHMEWSHDNAELLRHSGEDVATYRAMLAKAV